MKLEQGKTYVWHYDAGHAWLSVTVKELEVLEIDKRISIYSYYKRGIAYLEEDCDASTFITALEKYFPDDKYKYIEEDDGNDSPIRNYENYESKPFYDYHNQAWVRRGVYQACGHTTNCDCYGKAHKGQMYEPEVLNVDV
jgi:hypothetical protein